MKKLLSIILTAVISATTSISAFAYDKTNITVYNTEKHGLYITVGGTKIYCDKTELPFIDENDRTQIPSVPSAMRWAKGRLERYRQDSHNFRL